MATIRVWDFGALLTQAKTKSFASGALTPGIYSGMGVSSISGAGGLHIQIAPGSFLTPGGVLMVETDPVDTVMPVLSTAVNMTLTADHEDIQAIGGSPVAYTWRPTDGASPGAILPRYGSPNPNSVAILYCRYPGAGAITADMLSSPPSVINGQVLDSFESLATNLQAPFDQACDILAGPNIVRTPASHSSGTQILGWNIQNTAGVGLQNLQFRLPLPTAVRARAIEVFADIPSTASISFSTGTYVMKGDSGTTLSMTPSSIAGPVTALGSTPASTHVIGNTTEVPVSMGVTVTVPASGAVFLKGFRILVD